MNRHLKNLTTLTVFSVFLLSLGCSKKHNGVLCNEESLDAFTEAVSLEKTYQRLQFDSRATNEIKRDVSNSRKVSTSEFNQQSHKECQVQIKTQDSSTGFSTQNKNITVEDIQTFSTDPRVLTVERNEFNQPILVLKLDPNQNFKSLTPFELFQQQTGVQLDTLDIPTKEDAQKVEALLKMISQSKTLNDLFLTMNVKFMQIYFSANSQKIVSEDEDSLFHLSDSDSAQTAREQDSSGANEIAPSQKISPTTPSAQDELLTSKVEVFVAKVSGKSNSPELKIRVAADVTEEEIIIGLADYENSTKNETSQDATSAGSHLMLHVETKP